MADGALTLKLDNLIALRLEAAAREAGVTPETFVLNQLEQALTPLRQEDWTEADTRLDEYDRTGKCIPLERGVSAFDHALNAAMARKG